MRKSLSVYSVILSLFGCVGATAGSDASSNGGGTTDTGTTATDTASSDNASAGETASTGETQATADTAIADAKPEVAPAADSAADTPQTGCSEGKPCDDGAKCTTGDKCVGGQCVGTPLDCGKGLTQCKTGKCDPGSGFCVISDASALCDDNDPCTQGDFCIAGACSGFPVKDCCTKKCTGKLCGGDGCGGSCGSCPSGQSCGDGKCVKSTDAGETCAEAMAIDSLPFTHTGNTTGKKNDLLAPDQACYNGSLGDYGPDVVYQYTPTADGTIGVKVTGFSNKPAFYVATDCNDIKNSCLTGSLGYGQDYIENWAKVKKGKTIYIIVDADGDGGEYTVHVSQCPLQCAGKVCGYDGCGGDCGFCKKLSNELCSTAGKCVCVASCDNKKCGSDGCSGSCGTCTGTQTCDVSGQCVKGGQVGDTCKSAIAIAKSPFTVDASTVGFGNDVYAWASCQGKGNGAYWGYGGGDVVYSLGGAKSQAWFLELTKPSTNLEFWAFTDCADPVSCVQAAYKPASLKKQLFVETPTGAPLFVAVDGYDDQAGNYTLSATQCAKPGDCAGGDPGEYCSYPVVIDKLPFTANTTGSLDSYFVPAGACGNAKALGKGGQDRAFALVAAKTGAYTFTIKANSGSDPIVYATQDCTKLATSCGSFADKTGTNGSETLVLNATAGQTWYVVVDNAGIVTGGFSFNVTGP